MSAAITFVPTVSAATNSTNGSPGNDVVNGITSIIDNRESAQKVYVLKGPTTYTFVEMVTVLENQLQRKIIKVHLPVFLARVIALFAYLLKSDILYRDQIPRLLCRKDDDGTCSFNDLDIRPRQLEDVIKTICRV